MSSPLAHCAGAGGARLLPGPPHMLNIVTNEAAERFCYYGLRAILTLYLTDVLALSEGAAVSTVSYFIAGSYLSPLFGGFVADAYFGRYSTILGFCCVYLAGTVALAAGAFAGAALGLRLAGLYGGLALVALGTGGIKANIAPFGVDQLAGFADADTTSFFFVFYAAINCGSLLTYAVMPVARARAGFGVAFSLPMAALVLSIAVFLAARRHYVHQPPRGSIFVRSWRVLAAAVARPRGEGEPLMRGLGPAGSVGGGGGGGGSIVVSSPLGGAARGAALPILSALAASPPVLPASTFLGRARGSPGVEDSDVTDLEAVARIAPVFAVLPLFWSLYDSTSVTWTLQARRLDRGPIEPDQVQLLNPLLVVCFVPLFDAAVRRLSALPRRWRWLRPTPLRRMTAGCFLTATAFALSGLLESAVTGGAAPPSVAWQIPQFVVLSIAELCVSTTGLEFAFREAPPSAKGLIMALFFLTTTVGNLLNGVLYSAVDGILDNKQTIWLFTGLMLLASCLFALVASRYRPAVPEAEPDDGACAAKAATEATGAAAAAAAAGAAAPSDLELASGGASAKVGGVASWK